MSKKVLTSYPILSAQSLGASFNSASTGTQFLDRVCYQLTWTVDAVGVIMVQGSIDNITFVDLDINPIILNNAADSAIADIQVTAIPFVRLAYTRASGSGTISGYISGKE